MESRADRPDPAGPAAQAGLPLVIGSWNLYRRRREFLGANLLECLREVTLAVSRNSDVKKLER